jgi:hypothetical protein
MVKGTILLFIDSIFIVFLYKRAAARLGDRVTPHPPQRGDGSHL